MTKGKFAGIFGGRARKPEEPLTQREMDLAASIQAVTREVVLKLAQGIADESGEENLCLDRGVALNCAANTKPHHQPTLLSSRTHIPPHMPHAPLHPCTLYPHS